MDKTKLTLLIAMLCATPAISQAQPIEVGVSVATGTANGLASDFGGIYGGRGRAGAGQITLPVNERFAIQPFVSYGRWSDAPYPGPGVSGGETDSRDALFGAVVEQRFKTPRPALRAFMTYGIAAGYERTTTAPVEFISGATRHTIPGYSTQHFAEVPISVFGGGVQQAIGRHLAIRAEAQALGFFIIPLGVRASIGVAIALGK
jgi:hypothetical protein